MSGPHEHEHLTPEQIERLVHAARVERARAVRAVLSGVFRRLRGLFGARAKPRAAPSPMQC